MRYPMLEVGQTFPEFALEDQRGRVYSNEILKGKIFVIYFYPKDDTPGCTTEACGFRDSLALYEDAVVLGVSPDHFMSHRKFSDKFSLTFPLLSDTSHRLCEAVGVWVEKLNYGKPYMGVIRTTFLVDREGRVAHLWQKVKPEGHAAEVQAEIAKLR
jgi:peroxiredoxin Q/BCP